MSLDRAEHLESRAGSLAHDGFAVSQLAALSALQNTTHAWQGTPCPVWKQTYRGVLQTIE